MNPLFASAADLQRFLGSHRWRNAVIGGLAVQRWGEPRQTRDVDVALLTGMGDEARFIDALMTRYKVRRADGRAFALAHRVLLLETSSGVPLDVSLAALPYEERVMNRATEFVFAPNCAIVTCAAEDLVVLKAFADRPQDWLDIEGIVVRQGTALDLDLVERELRPLLELKEDLQPGTTLRRLFRRHP